ncbi:uncharacterized protein E0L32_011705 [Thyridium curvatum]|uniref:Uncharacterized protein n=1 Tax=Thyridium curvatum TaxID=1093900 RepID=A0A507B7R7_9PEZI|nr:uncharacterized protein E0L32_011705 [Thyridium curvatum]TPX18372.1 hypothetical protein E0L32_011705 [Thyridium curvatum]
MGRIFLSLSNVPRPGCVVSVANIAPSCHSFGDPNAQPPTPKQTPTSNFASPVFETPRQHQGSFDGSTGGWTPRFAEEYSVFNATPGNLRGGSGPFVDFSTYTSYQQSSTSKRQLSTGDIASEIAAHVNHFSPNPNLPPVDPSHRLSSSPALVQGPDRTSDPSALNSSVERSTKKQRRATITKEPQGQTATPPPSARKGERKLAPKLQTDEMQHEQAYGQHDFGTPHQSAMGTFVTTPSAVFGFPMSGRATAPAFTDSRPFWDPESGMSGMDVDFSGGADVFQTPTPTQHRPMNSADWARTNQIFQETGAVPLSVGQGNMQQPSDGFPAMSKSMAMSFDGVDQSMFATSYPTPIDDPFGIVDPTGGVNPGLLFSRPGSSNLEAASFMSEIPSSSAPAAPMSRADPDQMVSKAPMKTQLRRSMSTREVGQNRPRDMSSLSSPIKPVVRPGLSRSMSENRGKRHLMRSSATLPVLAPGNMSGSSENNSGRHLHGSRRASPPKSNIHSRLSSLTSIPETAGPKQRAQAQIVVDANGRASIEQIFAPSGRASAKASPMRRSTLNPVHRAHWDYSDDDGSSSDDEPIIIPSAKNSFVEPDPLQATSRAAVFAQRSFSDRSNNASASGLYASGADSLYNDPESEAETVMNEPHNHNGSGDAASELEKLRHGRPARRMSHPKKLNLGTSSAHKQQRFHAGGGNGGFIPRSYSENHALSPTTLTEASLPTPSSDRGHCIRCVCNRHEARHSGDDFMVQW